MLAGRQVRPDLCRDLAHCAIDREHHACVYERVELSELLLIRAAFAEGEAISAQPLPDVIQVLQQRLGQGSEITLANAPVQAPPRRDLLSLIV